MTPDAKSCWLAAGVAFLVWVLVVGGLWWQWLEYRP